MTRPQTPAELSQTLNYHLLRCSKKARYATRREAKQAAKALRRQGLVQFPYECAVPDCGCWHLSSLPREEGRRLNTGIRLAGSWQP